MTITNIRGTSGSGKSTLVHRLLSEATSKEEIVRQLGDWKKPKIVAYKVHTAPFVSYTGFVKPINRPTYVIGRYETQCGGCDSMSYKGSHNDIEALIREFLSLGNVIYEGLTISSTISRWLRISDENPGQFVWAFMSTPEEECYRRIIARSGREPKRNAKGLADYQIKYRGCMKQRADLLAAEQDVIDLTSDNYGYSKLLSVLE